MPDSPESRLAELRARVESLDTAVRAFASLPTQVGILTHDVDDLTRAHDRLREQVHESSKEVRTELRSLEIAADRREEVRREERDAERERIRLERKSDNRWRLATFLTVIGLAITILIAILTTYAA